MIRLLFTMVSRVLREREEEGVLFQERMVSGRQKRRLSVGRSVH